MPVEGQKDESNFEIYFRSFSSSVDHGMIGQGCEPAFTWVVHYVTMISW